MQEIIWVPSRVHPGSFYALPQSPQLFKQLLMCSGYDRFFQLARCYRDEDLRADRQREFTQIDMELSFVDVEDVLAVNERLLKKLFKEICNFDLELPITRMTGEKPWTVSVLISRDMRFGMELKNVSEVVKDTEFAVFKGALENGGSVRGINAKGQGAMPRKKIDALVDLCKGLRCKRPCLSGNKRRRNLQMFLLQIYVQKKSLRHWQMPWMDTRRFFYSQLTETRLSLTYWVTFVWNWQDS